MKLILSSDVKNFLKNSILTKQDLINKMNELFAKYPKVYTFVSDTIIKDNKIFGVDYATSDNMKDIECIYVHEIKTDPDAPTLKEYHKQRQKEKALNK